MAGSTVIWVTMPKKRVQAGKVSQRKVDLIRRKLKSTSHSMKAIAGMTGVPVRVVKEINTRTRTGAPIRDTETARMIGARATKEKKIGGHKINHFTAKQKWSLLVKNRPGILNVAKRWIKKSRNLQKKYASVGELASDITIYLFETLDYYNPEFIGRDNKKVKVFTYIWNRTEMFCRYAALGTRTARIKEIQYPVSRNKEIDFEERRKKPPAENDDVVVSFETKTVLKKIGNIPLLYRGAEELNDVIERIKQVLGKAGLTQVEKQIMKLRLKGKTMQETSNKIGVTKEWIRQLENGATEKIRKTLAK